MMSTFGRQVQAKYPFKGRHLLFGAVGGVVMGLAQLAAGQSADLATTAGIAKFVALSVGSWIGTELVKWNLRHILHQISDILPTLMEIRESLTEIRENLLVESEAPTREEGPTARKPSWLRRIRVWCMVKLPVLSLVLAPILLLSVFLDLGHDLFYLNFLRPVALGVTILALSSLVAQQGVLEATKRDFDRLALDLAQLREESPSQPIELSPENRQEAQHWHQVQHTASRWSRWLTGVSMDEGFPDPVA